MEQEIRDRGMTWVFKGTVDEMKDSFMDHVDGTRRHKIYQHLESDCSTCCKEKVKARISDLPLVNYLNVCTNEPESQQLAFCSTHSVLASKHGIPTNLREFLHNYCKVEKCIDVFDSSTINLSDARQINNAASNLPDRDQTPSNVADSQAVTTNLTSFPKFSTSSTQPAVVSSELSTNSGQPVIVSVSLELATNSTPPVVVSADLYTNSARPVVMLAELSTSSARPVVVSSELSTNSSQPVIVSVSPELATNSTPPVVVSADLSTKSARPVVSPELSINSARPVVMSAELSTSSA
ncbi:Hypothetical predicted protein [Paramuricea clavata]|uniref:Uncharacterized protein n=1 Tax=Paramuricea clavata TaxID=317549 RepID=A0A6S7HZG5_PARCT|nr:Hypothetical predicted protein [Paramuricea clavata]